MSSAAVPYEDLKDMQTFLKKYDISRSMTTIEYIKEQLQDIKKQIKPKKAKKIV